MAGSRSRSKPRSRSRTPSSSRGSARRQDGTEEKVSVSATSFLQMYAVLQEILVAIQKSDSKARADSGKDADSRFAAFNQSFLTMYAVLQQILTTIQRSTTILPEVTDKRLRFWTTYRRIADEFDKDFLEQYRDDMDASMIFAGLFSAVCATFAVLMQPALNPDPNLATQALLQAIFLTLNGTSVPDPVFPAWPGPSRTTIWVQCLLYASLSCTLFAALGAVLGKQWLNHYSRVGEHGSVEDRGIDRHRKFMNLDTYHFRTVLEVLPVLLQTSLLLFGLALSAYIWDNQHTIGTILVVANGIGALFYFSVVSSSVLDAQSPFYTPISFIRDMEAIKPLIRTLKTLPATVAKHAQQLRRWVRKSSSRSDEEAQELESTTPDAQVSVLARSQPSDVVPKAVAWVLVTSTDPIVVLHALQLATELRWRTEDIAQLSSQIIDRSLAGLISCVQRGTHGLQIPESSRQRAILYCNSLVFFYWAKLGLDPGDFQMWSRGYGQQFIEEHSSWASDFIATTSIKESSDTSSTKFEEEETTFALVHLTFSHLRSVQNMADVSLAPSHAAAVMLKSTRGTSDSAVEMLRSHMMLNLAHASSLPTDLGSSFDSDMIQDIVRLATRTQAPSLHGVCVLAIGVVMRRWGDETTSPPVEALNDGIFELRTAAEYSFQYAESLIRKISWSDSPQAENAFFLISSFLDVLHNSVDKGHKATLRAAQVPNHCLDLCALLHTSGSKLTSTSALLRLTSRLLRTSITCVHEPCPPEDLHKRSPHFLQDFKWDVVPSASHIRWIVEFLTALHKSPNSDRNSEIWLTTAHAFLVVASSTMSELVEHAQNPELLRVLHWALHIPHTGPWPNPAPTTDPLYLLHCATTTLITRFFWYNDPSLLKQYAFWQDRIPDLPNAWCSLVEGLAPVSKNSPNWHTDFLGFIVYVSYCTPDGQWLNQSENGIYVQQCITAVQHQLRRTDRVDGAARALLLCERLFDVGEMDPLWRRSEVQFGALLAVAVGWWAQTSMKKERSWFVFPEEKLCERTAQFMLSEFWQYSHPLMREYLWVVEDLLAYITECQADSKSQQLSEFVDQVEAKLKELNRPEAVAPMVEEIEEIGYETSEDDGVQAR